MRARGRRIGIASVLAIVAWLPGPPALAVPEHDAFAAAIAIGSLPFQHATSTEGATIEAGEPLPPCAFTASTVWYRFVWPQAETFRVSIDAGFDSFVAAYEGSSLETLSLAGCANGPGPGAVLDLPVSGGLRYWLQVGGAAGEAGSLVVGADALEVETCPDCIPPCVDRAFKLLGFVMPPRRPWVIRAATLPPGLPASEVVEAIRRGVRNVERARNDCGLPDRVDLRARFLGRALVRSSFSDAEPGRCVPDRRSVVDFGPLPASDFAQTCTRTRIRNGRRVLVQADIRFNELFTWWTGDGPCAGAFDIEGVMTHEWGHAVGLDHVRPESLLTMAERPPEACSTEWRTLGRGDLRGLRTLY